MPNIEFENPQANFAPTRNLYEERISKITKMVMDTGLAKTKERATMVLLAIAISAIILSILIIILTFSRNDKVVPGSPTIDISSMDVSRLRR